MSAIQSATGQAVAAVRSVVTTIGQVSEIASAIVASVEQQGAATREIAVQVQGISATTQSATRAMRGVCGTAEQSSVISHTVLAAADQVAAQSDGLRQEVDHFLKAVRASQTGEDRRRYERLHGTGVAVRLRCATYGIGTAALRDISLGGAALVCDWPCDVGAEVLVGLPGEQDFVSARIVDSREGLLAVTFRQDTATLAVLDHAMKTLVCEHRMAA